MPLVDLLKRLGVRKEPAVKCCQCPFANSTGPVDQRSRIPSEQRGDGAYSGLCLAHKGARALLLAANNVGSPAASGSGLQIDKRRAVRQSGRTWSVAASIATSSTIEDAIGFGRIGEPQAKIPPVCMVLNRV
jgi:hypothetical protein